MADTPLLDELLELGDAGEQLLAACERVVDQARRELDLLEQEKKRAQLDQRVLAFFAAHPDASANAAWRELGGTRSDVLAAANRVRAVVRPVPNHPEPLGDAA